MMMTSLRPRPHQPPFPRPHHSCGPPHRSPRSTTLQPSPPSRTSHPSPRHPQSQPLQVQPRRCLQQLPPWHCPDPQPSADQATVLSEAWSQPLYPPRSQTLPSLTLPSLHMSRLSRTRRQQRGTRPVMKHLPLMGPLPCTETKTWCQIVTRNLMICLQE